MSVSTRRLVYANRSQREWRDESLDALLPLEHSARDVWEFVVGLDAAPLLAGIRALPGSAGAPEIDPRMLLGLWLYATVQGIGSSRRLAELCENHLAYRWLCGRVSVCYHTLSDFRSSRGEYLDQAGMMRGASADGTPFTGWFTSVAVRLTNVSAALREHLPE
jgi:transposase